jgi:hypothetical protein
MRSTTSVQDPRLASETEADVQIWTEDGEEIPLTGGDVTDRADTLGGGWQRMWSDGVGDKIRHRQIWLEENADSITTALVLNPVPADPVNG